MLQTGQKLQLLVEQQIFEVDPPKIEKNKVSKSISKQKAKSDNSFKNELTVSRSLPRNSSGFIPGLEL